MHVKHLKFNLKTSIVGGTIKKTKWKHEAKQFKFIQCKTYFI